ncbi:hypothetical protein GTU99_25755, partial [Streptomyces sp. PRKS01-65]|nr:hypothetical protein [Streptomyces harenosi]
MHGPEATRSVPAGRLLALVTLTFTLAGAPAGAARADACAYAHVSDSPGGSVPRAGSGGESWPTFPPCPAPTRHSL